MADTKEVSKKVKTPKTPEQKAAKLLKKKARLGNIAIVKELVDKQSDKKFETALKVLFPKAYDIRVKKEGTLSLSDKVVAYIRDKKQVSEDELFKNFKVGRKDCAGIIRKSLKKAAPDARVWVAFDAKSGVYSLAGTGKAKPASWTGYVPSDDTLQVSKSLK